MSRTRVATERVETQAFPAPDGTFGFLARVAVVPTGLTPRRAGGWSRVKTASPKALESGF